MIEVQNGQIYQPQFTMHKMYLPTIFCTILRAVNPVTWDMLCVFTTQLIFLEHMCLLLQLKQ